MYRVSFNGRPDFELLQGSDPCMSMKFYCLSFNESACHYKACFNTLHARVSLQLGYHWSFVHKRLEVSENLFIDCSEVSEWQMVNKPKIGLAVTGEPELDYNLTYPNSYRDAIIQELLDHINVLIKNDSFNEKEIARFDSQTNKMKLNIIQKFELYRKALLMFPTNLFIVNQFGLALMGIGFEEDARLLFHNGVVRGLWDNPLQRPVFVYTRELTSKPWHDKHKFSFTAALENGAGTIKKELYHNLENSKYLFLQDHENMPNRGSWKAIKLISNDGQRTKYTDYFPKTMEIIDNCGQQFISIKFSAIQPGTHIAPHTGPSNQGLRVHLSLVHTGGARIRVGTEWKSWEVEKVIILDSSWEHEVIHNGNDTRIVLILDIWHPEVLPKD